MFLWICLMLTAFPSLGYEMPAKESAADTLAQNSPRDTCVLSAADKEELAEALRLKSELGELVWPGFAGASISLILFNERYELLVAEENPTATWQAVKDDDFLGKRYYFRPAKDPQAFAEFTGKQWAGSAGTLESMNRKGPFKFTPEFHIVMILHEAFHAYEAQLAPTRFKKALAVYASEGCYPAKDGDFAATWTSEGEALAEALKATDNATMVSRVQKFLQLRDERRRRAGLRSDPLAFERELEWLEGLAEYSEIRLYELAASRAGEQAFSRYKPGLPLFLQWDFVRLQSQLGQQDGDLRFYVSGMAQARLLDRLSPDWKAKVMQEGVYLDELLRAAIKPQSN